MEEEYFLFDEDLLEQSKRNLEKAKTENFNETEKEYIIDRIDVCIFIINFILEKINQNIDLKYYFPYFIKYYKSDFDGNLYDINKEVNERTVKYLFLSIIRVIREINILSSYKFIDLNHDDIDIKIKNFWSDYKDNKYKTNEEKSHHYYKYFNFDMNGYEISVLMFYIQGEIKGEFKYFTNYEQNKIEVQQLNKEHKKNIETINELSKKIENLKSDYNFVSLSYGFQNILDKKEKNKKSLLYSLRALGIIVIFPLILKILKSDWINISWQELLGWLGLEFILIYYFRIILNQYYSVQAEINQLELRQSLCAFIQSYADYAKELKDKSAVTLDKFENIIFSNIMSNPEQIPSTFDGMEQLSNLIKALKGKE